MNHRHTTLRDRARAIAPGLASPELLALAVLFLLTCLAALPARAQDYNAALDKFLSDSFSDTEAGIAGVQAAGDPRGVPVIEALLDRRLLVNEAAKAIVYRDRAGATFDARTGEPAAAP